MRNISYEKLVDGMIETTFIFLWFCGIYVCAFIVTGIVFMIYSINYNSEASFLWFIFVPSGITSFPITFLYFYFRKAKKLYKIKRVRDFWVGFSHIISLPKADYKNSEIEKWLEENMNHMYTRNKQEVRLHSYHFISKSDAMAFKLRWL